MHLRADVGCKSCHGSVDEMDIVRQVQPLSMGWCLECHRDPTSHVRPQGVSVTDATTTEPGRRVDRCRQDPARWSGDAAPHLNPPIHCSACHR
ncbi:MAG: hypothetical protein R3F29_05225 [Planctomycetota bacterium]